LIKNIILLAFLILNISSCDTLEKPNDIKEYGYFGDIKKMKSTRYKNLNKEGENWIIEKEKIIFKQEKYFNTDGNIFKVKYFYPIDNTSWEEQILNVKFEKGLKQSYVILDNKSNFIESAIYTWNDNMNYEAIAERDNGTKALSFSKLNKNFRDLSGGYQYFQNDSLVESETYQNNFGVNGELTSSDYVDEIKNIKYRVVYKSLEKDSIGNTVLKAIEESDKLKYLETREFEYYE